VIPGKAYKPEDFVEILWRRKWVIVIPLFVIGVATFVWSRTLPDRYRSEALVLVVAPQVPDNLVKSTITERLQERLDTMRQQILSRPRLERIITELDLYREERKRLLMDEVVAIMRNDVKLNVAKARRKEDPGSFTVSFEYGEPKTAQVVVERMAALFVRENLEGRSLQADVTAQFLQSQLDDARQRLHDQEARISAFRQANAGRLPSQVQTNLHLMQATQQQIQSLNDEITRDRDRQATIERTISDEEAIGALVTTVTHGGGGGEGNDKAPKTAAQELAAAKEALAQLHLRLTAEHPDVRAATRRVAELEQKAASEALQQPVTAGGVSGPVTPADAARLRKIASLRAEYDSLERMIGVKRAEMDRLQAAHGDLKQRVDAAPALETQLDQLTRDHETLETSYATLLKKQQDAKVSASLEEKQVGQQFRIIDPARVPERPSSPDRLKLSLMGLLAGLGLGLGVAALLEYRDTSLRTEADVLVALSLPVIALVPTLETADERRHRRRRRLLILASSTATLAIGVAALGWKLRLFENWVR
jgi:polysaccharide chain length determinant protein (PEP-CTERM system associated)